MATNNSPRIYQWRGVGFTLTSRTQGILKRRKIAPSSKPKFMREAAVIKDYLPSPPKKPRAEHYEEIRRPVPKPVYKVPEEPLPQRKKPVPRPSPDLPPSKPVYEKPVKPVKTQEVKEAPVVKEVTATAKDSGSDDEVLGPGKRRRKRRSGVKRNGGTRTEFGRTQHTKQKPREQEEVPKRKKRHRAGAKRNGGTRTEFGRLKRYKRKPREPAAGTSQPPEKTTSNAQRELSSVMSSILHDELQQIMIKKLPAHIKVIFEERFGKDNEVATVQQLIELLDEKIRVKEVQKPERSTQATVTTVAKPVAVPPPEKQSTIVEPSGPACTYCKISTHTLHECPEFLKMSVTHRKLWAKMAVVCFKCLQKHFPLFCTCTESCAKCSSPLHDTLLCDAETEAAASEPRVEIIFCQFCKNSNHRLYQCEEFKKMPLASKNSWVKTYSLCYKCYEPHVARVCNVTVRCSNCNSSRHTSLLCDKEIMAAVQQTIEPRVDIVVCSYCKIPTHALYQCAQFNQITVSDRWHFANTSGICFKCLNQHPAGKCTSTDVCSNCNSPQHNSLLCDKETKTITVQQSTEPIVEVVAKHTSLLCDKELKTAAGTQSTEIIVCAYCKNPTHALYQCAQFNQMPVAGRRHWVKTSSLCFKCFKPHLARECTCTDCCSICNSAIHNSLLCDKELKTAAGTQSTEIIVCAYCKNPTHALYQCAQFNQMPVVGRRHWVKTSSLCFKCFKPHLSRGCAFTDVCNHCNSPKHNSLLCYAVAEIASVQYEETITCLYCKNPTHLLYQCAQFNQMTVIDRRHWTKTSGFCFKCFQPHFLRDCTCTDCCNHCNSPMHNSLLCGADTAFAPVPCSYCGNPTHLLYQCAQFSQITVIDRRQWANESGLCFKCFEPHYARDCTCTDFCNHCNSPMHNSLLCDAEDEMETAQYEKNTCLYCGNPTHLLYQCAQFNQMAVTDRRQWARESGLCFKCFEPHFARDCTCTDCCNHCNSPMHNSLLCDAKVEVAPVPCLYCGNPTHLLYQCAQFNQMSIPDRRYWARESGLCFKCFESHYARDCTSIDVCDQCNSPMHSSLLCDSEAEMTPVPHEETITCLYCGDPTHILYECAQFNQMTFTDRRQWTKGSCLCFKCFDPHLARDCTCTDCCNHCNSPMHNSLLCNAVVESAPVPCSYCGNPTHLLYQCAQFHEMTISDRRYWARESGLCFKCFEPHYARDCTSIDVCDQCNSPMHSSLLCDSEAEMTHEETTTCLYCGDPTHVLYQCAQFNQMTDMDKMHWAEESGLATEAQMAPVPHEETMSCLYCGNPTHVLYECAQFNQMTPRNRKTWAKESGLCFKCLDPHFVRDCTCTDICDRCNSPKHNSLFCNILQIKSSSKTKTTEISGCAYCMKDHTLYECHLFIRKSVQRRKIWTRNCGICFKCLKEQCAQDCTPQTCEHCSSTQHHSLLCEAGTVVVSDTNSSVCPYCNKTKHQLDKCAGFLLLSPKNRRLWASKKTICFKCLQESSNHDCSSPCCSHCNSNEHNSILCDQAEALQTPSAGGCPYCKKADHKLLKCPQFPQQSVHSRWHFARQYKLCFRCLEYCTRKCSTPSCTHCGLQHALVLCKTYAQRPDEQQSTKPIDKKVQDISVQAPSSKIAKVTGPAGKTSTVEVNSCPVCMEQTHTLSKCEQFLEKTLKDRRQYVKKTGSCFKCLGNHFARHCTSKDICSKCSSDKHHSLMCESTVEVLVQNAEKTQVKDTSDVASSEVPASVETTK